MVAIMPLNIGRAFVEVSSEDIARVAPRAIRALVSARTGFQREMAARKRARRRKFNASWLGRVLFFLRKDPDEDIPIPDGIRGPNDRWTRDMFKLSLYTCHIEEAQGLLDQAHEVRGSVRVQQDEWSTLCRWAAHAGRVEEKSISPSQSKLLSGHGSVPSISA